jgi:hypothetical protein
MQLLTDAVETYRAEDVARWWHWESAAEGRRQLGWSRGQRSLRCFAGSVTTRATNRSPTKPSTATNASRSPGTLAVAEVQRRGSSLAQRH